MGVEDKTKSGKHIPLSGNAVAKRRVIQGYMGDLVTVRCSSGKYYSGKISEVNGTSFSLRSDNETFPVHYSDLRALVL